MKVLGAAFKQDALWEALRTVVENRGELKRMKFEIDRVVKEAKAKWKAERIEDKGRKKDNRRDRREDRRDGRRNETDNGSPADADDGIQ